MSCGYTVVPRVWTSAHGHQRSSSRYRGQAARRVPGPGSLYKRLQSPQGPKSWHELQCWGHPGLIYCSGHSFMATLPPTTSPSLLYSALVICKSSWVIIIIMMITTIPILWLQPKGQAAAIPKKVSSLVQGREDGRSDAHGHRFLTPTLLPA